MKLYICIYINIKRCNIPEMLLSLCSLGILITCGAITCDGTTTAVHDNISQLTFLFLYFVRLTSIHTAIVISTHETSTAIMIPDCSNGDDVIVAAFDVYDTGDEVTAELAPYTGIILLYATSIADAL